VRRHLLPPGAIRRDAPPAPAAPARCPHGAGAPCPWPGCEAGVLGARLVVCGVGGPRYFARALDIEVIHPAVPQHGRLVVRWVEVEADGSALEAREVAACAY
jgi:hypothetical protein